MLFLLKKQLFLLDLPFFFVALLVLQEFVKVATFKILVAFWLILIDNEIDLACPAASPHTSGRCLRYLPPFLSHELRRKGASFELFGLTSGLSLALTCLLASPSALQVLLNSGQVHSLFLCHGQSVVFCGHENISALRRLVEHLLHEILVCFVKVLSSSAWGLASESILHHRLFICLVSDNIVSIAIPVVMSILAWSVLPDVSATQFHT